MCVCVCHPVPQDRALNQSIKSNFCSSIYIVHAVREKQPDLVENAVIVLDNATVHAADTVRNVCWQ